MSTNFHTATIIQFDPSKNASQVQTLAAAGLIKGPKGASTIEANDLTREVAGTTFSAGSAASSRYTQNVRNAAKSSPNFQDALVPMIQASGVSDPKTAGYVKQAIMNNDKLRNQAERAWKAAQND